MIELRITGADGPELVAQLTSFAALLAGTATTQAPAKGRSSNKPAPAQEKAADPTGDAAAANSAASSEAIGAGTVDRASVAAKCTQYGSPQKGGPAALKQLFVEFGSANGKWSEITDDKLAALNVRLDELLA